MKRIALEDGSWFNEETATHYKESRHHDGNNFISDATGTQWEHEALYRTTSGQWIVNHWSQWQGSTETYKPVSSAEAAAWLVRNGHEAPDELATAVASLEV